MRKCTKEKLCPTMDKMVAPEVNAHAKGLVLMEVMSANCKSTRVIGVAYKTSSTDRGVLLNCCPWCKENIDWF